MQVFVKCNRNLVTLLNFEYLTQDVGCTFIHYNKYFFILFSNGIACSISFGEVPVSIASSLYN